MRLALQHLPKIILAIILIIMITKPFQRRLLQAQVQVQASPLGTPILGQEQTRTCHCHINMMVIAMMMEIMIMTMMMFLL